MNETAPEQMTQKLIQCKHALEEQGLEDSSLSDVFHLLDTLINLMELLGDNFATLQQNATAIAEEFSTLDQSLSYRYGNHITTQSYQAYEQDRLNKMYRGY